MDLWAVIASAILAIIVIIANLSCLVIIITNRNLHRPAHIAIAGLLLAHFIQGLFVLPSYAAKRAKFTSNIRDKGIVCDTFRFSYMFTNYDSCLCLLVITMDRLFAARFPLRHSRLVTSVRILYANVAVSVYALLLCLIPFIPESGGHKPGCKYRPQKEWVTTMLIAHQFSPFVVILVCYTYIFNASSRVRRRKLTANYKTGHAEQSTVRFMTRKLSTGQMRTVKMSFLIILCYMFCWGPSLMYYLLQQLCTSCYSKEFWDSEAEQIIGFVIKFLTFFDGILAPMVYCLKDPSFRVAFKTTFRRWFNLHQQHDQGMDSFRHSTYVPSFSRKLRVAPASGEIIMAPESCSISAAKGVGMEIRRD